ncbi:MAG TPA: hypothetical protein VF232_02560 [Gaiellaceae bacterium]
MRRVGPVVLGLIVVALLASATGMTASGAKEENRVRPCRHERLPAGYVASVKRALEAGQDVWGNELLRSPSGPTYLGAARHLRPLLLAARSARRYLTRSGMYYLPFASPTQFGAHNVALHVADGSGIFANVTRGRKLTINVGRSAGERFGSCLARLSTPQLADGYLPILQTRYVDGRGVPYRQESFSTVNRETGGLLSFVRVTADTTGAHQTARIRFMPSTRGLTMSDGVVVRGRSPQLFVSLGWQFDGKGVTYEVPPGQRATVYVAWPVVSGRASEPFVLDETSYLRARQAVESFWSRKLADGAIYDVPERRVQDAERSLLIQNLTLSWRYSVGNQYHRKLSTPEAIDSAGVMGEYGFDAVNRSILDASFWRPLSWTANWKIGEQLLGSARYYALFGDRAYVDRRTPVLARYVAHVRRQLIGRSLLRRERYSADVGEKVYGLHSQAVVWEGLRAMASVWESTGHPALAARARAVAARLGSALRRAVRRSARRVKDGSLFVPIRLVDGERPYKKLTASRSGSFWNLVMPYALASGILPPHSAQARDVLRYMLGHGSRILGLVRASAFTLYRDPEFPRSGTDQVYGLSMARFLADNDRADQLVVSLYGQLAAGMTRGTYISGEAATVAPVRGELYRKMFLPPNSGSNAAFLETLRLMLVHEVEDSDGAPHGLELAFATPRSWLRPGRTIAVQNAPTSFGMLSYTVSATANSVHASLDFPASAELRTQKLRLRLPGGRHLAQVLIAGRAYGRFDRQTGTIDLTGLPSNIELDARFG